MAACRFALAIETERRRISGLGVGFGFGVVGSVVKSKAALWAVLWLLSFAMKSEVEWLSMAFGVRVPLDGQCSKPQKPPVLSWYTSNSNSI